MSTNSKIEWTEDIWNPLLECCFKKSVARLAEYLIKVRNSKNLNPPNRKWFFNEARRLLRAYLILKGWQ